MAPNLQKKPKSISPPAVYIKNFENCEQAGELDIRSRTVGLEGRDMGGRLPELQGPRGRRAWCWKQAPHGPKNGINFGCAMPSGIFKFRSCFVPLFSPPRSRPLELQIAREQASPTSKAVLRSYSVPQGSARASAPGVHIEEWAASLIQSKQRPRSQDDRDQEHDRSVCLCRRIQSLHRLQKQAHWYVRRYHPVQFSF